MGFDRAPDAPAVSMDADRSVTPPLDLLNLPPGITLEAATRWFVVYCGFKVGMYQGW